MCDLIKLVRLAKYVVLCLFAFNVSRLIQSLRALNFLTLKTDVSAIKLLKTHFNINSLISNKFVQRKDV